ncbi:MAG: hypothetical protein KBD78_09535 [Oligoflexales bacterium]|nr:hypothetical protein [Oligoflexales bacterium]
MKTLFLKSVMSFALICSSNVFATSIIVEPAPAFPGPSLPILNDVSIVVNDPCANLQPGWACAAVMPNDDLQFSVISNCEGNFGVDQSKLGDGSIALTVNEYAVLHMGIIQCEANPVKRHYSLSLGTSLTGTQYVLVNKIGLGSN